MSSPNEEDLVYCAPRYQRGHGGVAILWRKNLYNVQKLKQFASHCCMGISIDNSTFIFSVYLPSRTGCTNSFKESLDTLQVIKEKLTPSGLLVFAGDLTYLKAKREFHKALRAWKQDQDFSFYASLDLNHNSDKLFRLLQNKSGTQPNLTNRILIDNQVYSGNRTFEGWAKHFENLGEPFNHDFDESFFHKVNNELKEMVFQSEDQPDATLIEISEEEVYKAIHSLQMGIASRPDQIQPEHVRYGGSPWD